MNFEIPHDIQNDILYCQKTLGDYVKFYKMWINKTMHVKKDTKVKRISVLFEREISQIGRDQKGVVDRLRLALEKYIDEMEKNNVVVNRQMECFHVSQKLKSYFNNFYDIVRPLTVKKRPPAEEFYKKHHCNILEDELRNMLNLIKSEDKIEVLLSPSDVSMISIANTPVVTFPTVKQVSLLKPKVKRVSLLQKNVMQPSTSLLQINNNKNNSNSNIIKVTNISSSFNTINTNNNNNNTNNTNKNNTNKNNANKNNNKKNIKNNNKNNDNDDKNDNNNNNNNNCNNSNKTIEECKVLINHEIPREISRASVMPSKVIKPSPSSSILHMATVTENMNNSRMNLIQALRKAKSQVIQSSSVTASLPPTTTTSNTTAAAAITTSTSTTATTGTTATTTSTTTTTDTTTSPPSLIQISTLTNLKESLKSGPPSPELSDSQSSNDSSDVRLVIFEEDEPEPEALEQESFLRLFSLYTPEYCEYLKTRRSKRQRRQVTSTEKCDFHYGKFDLFEKQVIRRNKRSILYSPPATRAFKKRKLSVDSKQFDNASTSSSSAASINNDNNDRLCIICSKNGDKLKECKLCNGLFHSKCHTNSFNSSLLKHREKLCPKCLRKPDTANNS